MLKVFSQDGEDANSVDPNEQKHAALLLKRIKSFRKPLKERAKKWKLARKYADGDVNDDGGEGLVRVNLIGSMLETIQPTIYAKEPEITVEIDERINTEQYPMLGKFAKTLDTALNVLFVKDGYLKKRGKRAVRGSLTSTIGYTKIIYQKDRKEDPIIKNRINDTQDNLDAIKVLIEDTKEEGGITADYEAQMFTLKQQLSALEKQIEVVTAEGIVIDYVDAERIIILDSSATDVDDYPTASAIAHEIDITVGAFKKKFKMSPPKGFTAYTDQADIEDGTAAQDIAEDDKIVKLYEVWSLEDLTVYTVIEGVNRYVKPPYQPVALGEQWYPFFGLQLRRVDGKQYPRSPAEQLIESQDDYNTRKTNAREHRKKNLPVRVFNKSAGITDQEILAINNRSIGTDVIGVTSDNIENFNASFASLPEIPFNPQMYDTSDILFDMEKIVNTSDASSGAIRVAKTATEAEIANSGQQGRTSENLDVVEDWLTDQAIYAAQLLLQNVPKETIQARFGEDAVWPDLDKKTLFDMVDITIRSGSTAKPNKIRERDQWIQMLPEIQKSLETIALARQEGNLELENVTIALLNETLKRFDEKLDAKQLLGLVDEDGEDDDEIPAQVRQMIEKLKAELAASQEMIAKLQSGEALEERKLQIENKKLDVEEREVDSKLNVNEAALSEREATMAVVTEVANQTKQVSDNVVVLSEAVAALQNKPKAAKATKTASGEWILQTIDEGAI